MMDFVHLRCHSCFSLLEGAATAEELLMAAKEHGMTSLALTDTNGLYAAVTFWKKAREMGIKPIFGVELTTTLERGHKGERVVVLARDREGFAATCRLASARQLEDDFDLARQLAREAASSHLFVLTESANLLKQAICKKLSELMRGAIWAESEPGKGSTFIFTVICKRQTEVAEKKYIPTVDLRGIKVLVVDDNHDAIEIMRGYLENFTFIVEGASSGETALKMIEKNAQIPGSQPFKLILMDWSMPGMDGIETLIKIKENYKLSYKPKIIMLTAFGRDEVMKQAENAGLDAFLIKPVNQSVLYDTIMSVFGEKSEVSSEIVQPEADYAEDLKKIRGASILLAEDNEINQQVASELLEKEGFIVSVVGNGKEAVEAVDNWDYDVVLMDLQMPEMDGYEVCARLKSDEGTSKITIIFVTAKGEVEDETRGLELGAVDYITKPISPSIVKARVKNHIELNQARQFLESQNEILEERVRERTAEIKRTQQETLIRLMNASELRDTDTGLHIKRIQHYMDLLARKLGMNAEEAEEIGLASTMHDLGKIGIPDNVLLKPGKLDENEWRIMKTHPEIGARCLDGSTISMLNKAVVIALNHHERWDGNGYPSGLKHEHIPLEGRMLSIVDVFDALTTERPYKKAWLVEDAVKFIREAIGSQFDPKTTLVFLDHLQEFIEIKMNYSESSNDAVDGAKT